MQSMSLGFGRPGSSSPRELRTSCRRLTAFGLHSAFCDTKYRDLMWTTRPSLSDEVPLHKAWVTGLKMDQACCQWLRGCVRCDPE